MYLVPPIRYSVPVFFYDPSRVEDSVAVWLWFLDLNLALSFLLVSHSGSEPDPEATCQSCHDSKASGEQESSGMIGGWAHAIIFAFQNEANLSKS